MAKPSERNFQAERALVQKVLKDPELFPDEFKSWLRSYLNSHADIIWEQSQIPSNIPGSKIKPGSFLSLLTGGTDHKAAFGSGTLTWAGGSAPAGNLTVPHGLGATPSLVLALCTNTNDGFAVTAYIGGAVDATNIVLNGYAQGGAPAAGKTAKIYWLAIA